MEAQLDEETIDDEIAVESIEVPKADEQVDKKMDFISSQALNKLHRINQNELNYVSVDL